MVQSGMTSGDEGLATAKGNRLVGYVALGMAVILGAYTAYSWATNGDLTTGRLTPPVATVGMFFIAAVAFTRAYRLGRGTRS